MQVKEALSPTATNILRRYTLDVRQRSSIGGTPNENFVKAVIEKQLLSRNDTGYVFDLKTFDRTQSNTEGLRAMENDLAPLQAELVVQTDLTGEPVRILNLVEIKDHWNHTAKKTFRKKYRRQEKVSTIVAETDALLDDNAMFTENFKESEIGTLFFPPIYQSIGKEGDVIDQTKEFSGFFGRSPLPLNLKTRLKARPSLDGKIQILRQGSLNLNEFDQYNVRKFFRDLADNRKLAVPVTATYMETYDLDKYHGITHAGQVFGVQIEALFSFEQIARVTPVKNKV